jgi:hypothetical protein
MTTPSSESVSGGTGNREAGAERPTHDQLPGVAFGIREAAEHSGMPVVVSPILHEALFTHFEEAAQLFDGPPLLFYDEVERAGQLPFPSFLFTQGLFLAVESHYQLVTAQGLASRLGNAPIDRFAERAVSVVFNLTGEFQRQRYWLALLRSGRQGGPSALRGGLASWLSQCALSDRVGNTRRIAACLAAVALAACDPETNADLASGLMDLFSEQNREQIHALVGDNTWRTCCQVAIGCGGDPIELAGELGKLLEEAIHLAHLEPEENKTTSSPGPIPGPRFPYVTAPLERIALDLLLESPGEYVPEAEFGKAFVKAKCSASSVRPTLRRVKLALLEDADTNCSIDSPPKTSPDQGYRLNLG